MKNKITLFLIILCFVGFSQVPQQINYQGIARDLSGAPITSQAINLKFEIKIGSAGSSAVYTETQTVNTNSLGLFATQIGKTTSGINGVNWESGSVFLQIGLDASNSGTFSDLGSQQLFSVPFALAAPSPTLDYTNNVLTVGSSTVGINSASSQLSITAGANMSVTSGPNYTISAVTPSLILFNNSLTISGGNTVPLPAAYPQTTITPGGMASVSALGTNSFNVSVPAPSFNSNSGILSFGANTASITPALVLLPNGVLSAGPSSNSVALPSGVTVAGSGIAAVSGGPSYTVSVPNPTLSLVGNVLSSGSPTNFVNLPIAFPQGSITATSGLATITSIGTNTFNVNVPAPAYNSATGILSFGANTTSVTPALNLASGILSSGPLTNSVNLGNSGPWRQSVNTVTLGTSTDNVAIGGNAATARLDVQGTNLTTSSILKVGNTNAANTSNMVDIATNGGTALNISNTSASGIAGSFNSVGTCLSTQNTGSFPTFQATNSNPSPSAYAGQFMGGIVTSGKNALSTGFAFKAQDNSSNDLFTVRNDGFVGIGTNVPNGNFHVHSPISSVLSRLTSTAATTGLVTYIDGSSAALLNYQNTPLFFGTNGANRMVIDNTGRVGIGTSAPTATLHVNGTTRLTDGTEGVGKVLTSDASGNGTWQAPATSSSNICIIKDVKLSNIDGGSFVSGAWQTRDLNTVEGNAGLVSVSSNQFTLQAGIYYITAKVPAYRVNTHKARLRNITDATTSIVGQSSSSTASQSDVTFSEISGVITINSPKTFQVQHFCQSSSGSLGFGVATSSGASGENEVYTQVQIIKLQ